MITQHNTIVPDSRLGQGVITDALHMNAVPGKRSKWTQGPNESLADFNSRVMDNRIKTYAKLREKRLAVKRQVVDKAIAMMSANREDITRISNATGQHAMSTSGSDVSTGVLSQSEAVHAAIPTRLLGTRQANDIIASLTVSFDRGFSSAQGKIHNTPSQAQMDRAKIVTRAMLNMRKHGQVSRGDIFTHVRPIVNRVPHTPRYEPCSLEVFTITERLMPKAVKQASGLYPSISSEYPELTRQNANKWSAIATLPTPAKPVSQIQPFYRLSKSGRANQSQVCNQGFHGSWF